MTPDTRGGPFAAAPLPSLDSPALHCGPASGASRAAAGADFEPGGCVTRTIRVAELCGCAFCLVAVVTLLISLANLVGAAIDLGDSLHLRRWGGGPKRSLV